MTLSTIEESILSFLQDQRENLYSFSPNQLLLDQGAARQNILFLLKGHIEVSQYDLEGKRSIATYLKAPQFLGLVEYLAHQGNISSKVRSLSQGQYITISPGSMEKLLEDKDLARYFLEYLAHLNQDNISLRSKEKLMDKKKQLMDFFYDMSSYAPLPYRLDIRKQDISDLLQISPRTLYRYLGELEKEGYIRRRGGAIWIYPDNLLALGQALE